MKRLLVHFVIFPLLSMPLFAQSKDDITMQFGIGIHRDTSFLYTYKSPYLVRNTEIYTATGLPTRIQQKDTVYIDGKKYGTLKKYAQRYISNNRGNTEVCAAWTPIYGRFIWEEKKSSPTQSYRYTDVHAHCHNNVLPQRYWNMKAFLDNFYR